ncbi:hypothetical protein BGW41_007781, partial [Actinomortierella wolfii]
MSNGSSSNDGIPSADVSVTQNMLDVPWAASTGAEEIERHYLGAMSYLCDAGCGAKFWLQ